MKIAFPTDDGTTISAHLGRAIYFQVDTVEGKEVTKSEKLSKAHHGEVESHLTGQVIENTPMHDRIFGALEGVDVLIAGGMGQPAFEHAQSLGIKVILTGEKDIKNALQAFLNGNLPNDPRRIHTHH